ncbi:MAG: glycoside hydrolase family 3 N-terminal domain-containing protein, partial [Dysgonomonas sp.]
MRKSIIMIVLFCMCFFISAQKITPEVRMRAEKILQKMTLEEKIDYISGFKITYPGLRPMHNLGIPVICMADGPQGIRKYEVTESTLYPCGILASATWNRDLVKKMGVGLGQDARARGIHILLGPGVNIYKSPLCGRNFEYYG